jgi:arylsulfatase A-like enzyme/Flp pilus assembly protein TadD
MVRTGGEVLRRAIVGAFVVLAATVAACRGGRAKGEPGLDVLLITVDTLRADALGAFGNERASTPWIDRLAEGGLRFTRAYAHNVVTLPSHSNILSGRYPFEHGVRDNAGFRFPPDVETLATRLKRLGYRTGAFVSAFPLSSRFGLARGFDAYDDSFLSGAGLRQADEERPGPVTVEAARRWLAAGSGPTFLWVHLYEPHFPYEPREPFASRFPDDPYLGEVAAADAALEPLLRPLVGAGKSGRTVVVFTGDHGESRGEHGEKTHGIFAYEGPLRVPLIVFCPRLASPARVESPVRHVDIVPTILEAIGAPRVPDLPGRSLLAARTDPDSPPSYFEALFGMMSRRWAPLYGVVRGPLKYIELPMAELYDLTADRREERNLVATRPEDLDRMKALLGRIRAADRGPSRGVSEDAETRERLRALGYLAASDAAPSKERYTEDDDPKRLIALDAELQAVDARRKAGDLAGALVQCEDVVRRRPTMPLALVQLSLLQREAGRLPEALKTAERALALAPDDAQTASTVASHLNDLGRFRESAELLEPYAGRSEPSLDVLLTRGAALAETQRTDEALAVFRRALDLAPTSARILVDVGNVHLAARQYEPAREAFDQAIARQPDLARAHNGLGVLAAETGHLDEAVARWKKAAELDPQDWDTLYNLGRALRRAGRDAEARPYVERFAREAPPALYARDIREARQWLGKGSRESQ